MPRPKGLPKTGGRKPGSVNKITKTLREDVLQALSNKGGIAYIEALAATRPELFVSLLSKCMPTTIAPEPDSKGYTFTWKVTANA